MLTDLFKSHRLEMAGERAERCLTMIFLYYAPPSSSSLQAQIRISYITFSFLFQVQIARHHANDESEFLNIFLFFQMLYRDVGVQAGLITITQ